MTKDTIFDLASLTKSLATATAVLQLFEHGRVKIDDSVQTYLPNFNTANDPRRARVAIRMLLTHTSGLAGDLSLDAPWGLDRADKAEGIHRALNARVEFGPGEINDGTVRGSWSAMRTTATATTATPIPACTTPTRLSTPRLAPRDPQSGSTPAVRIIADLDVIEAYRA